MGSWSEGCGVSGMEIAHGAPAYCALLRPNSYDENRYQLVCPPIKGKYNDYGRMIVDKADRPMAELFDVFVDEKGIWDPREQTACRGAKVSYFWIDAVVFDNLSGLERDFSWNKDDSTINGDLIIHLAKINECVKKTKKINHSVLNDFDGSYLTEAFGYTESVIYRPYLLAEGLITLNEPLDTFMEGYRRSYILTVAMMELRKVLGPQAGQRGPQHGGAPALIKFYDTVLVEAKRRYAIYREG